MGPATMSELLSYSNPDEYIIYNSATAEAFSYLDVPICSKYDYKCTGEKYLESCQHGKKISQYMATAGFHDVSLLAVDYLMWDELPSKGDTSKGNVSIIYNVRPIIQEQNVKGCHLNQLFLDNTRHTAIISSA